MLLVALLIGVILIVAAIRNSQDALFAGLAQDVPAFIVWGAAIIAIGAIGVIPGLKPASRALIILVFVVIILTNYQKIIAGFQQASSPNVGKSSTNTSSSTAITPGGGSFGGGGASASY